MWHHVSVFVMFLQVYAAAGARSTGSAAAAADAKPVSQHQTTAANRQAAMAGANRRQAQRAAAGQQQQAYTWQGVNAASRQQWQGRLCSQATGQLPPGVWD
jgi:hypothetical protein